MDDQEQRNGCTDGGETGLSPQWEKEVHPTSVTENLHVFQQELF